MPEVRRSPLAGAIRQAVPVLVAAALCVYLIRTVGWQAIDASFGRARFDWLVPATVVFIALDFWLETAGLWVLYSHTVVRTPYREIQVVRAVTQFLGVFNVWLSQMGTAVYYARRSGLPMTYLTGVQVLLALVDLTVAFLFAGMIVKPTGTQYDAIYMTAIAAGLTLFPVIFLARRYSEKKFNNLAAASVWFTGTGLRQIFAPIFLIPVADLLLLLFSRICRTPLRAAYLLVALLSFHVEVAAGTGLLVGTFTLLLGSIPLTPMGVGITQAAGLLLFAGLGAPGDVLAALFAFTAAQIAGSVVFGLYYLKGGLELMKLPPPTH